MSNRHLSAALAASFISGLLTAFSMPNVELSFLAWIALVPLYIAIDGRQLTFNRKQWIAFPGTLIWSYSVHSWYPDVLGPFLGYLLIIAVGVFFAAVIAFGKWIEERMKHRAVVLFALPITWTALEWLRSVAPVTREWWFVPLANSQVYDAAVMQVLAIGGLGLLAFLLMLVNVSVARMMIGFLRERRIKWELCAGIALPVLFIASINLLLPAPSGDPVKIAAISDMITQNESITTLAQSEKAGDGYVADTDEMMQAIFDVNAAMTREVVREAHPDFVVWSENEFTRYDHEDMIGQVKALAKELGIYLVADVVWQSETGMHDTALMIGPDGEEVGKRAKIRVTDGESAYGFDPGAAVFDVFDTPYGKVGLAVCWDKHRPDIVRELVKNGADLILIPDDNDFNGNGRFLKFASSDSVFRAAENRTAVVSASVSGNSMVVDGDGAIQAMTEGNRQEAAVGEVHVSSGSSVYQVFGEWFAVLCTLLLAAYAIGLAIRDKTA